MKGKSATLLVLVLAAVVLGCFALKSYFDFQVTKLEYEMEQKTGTPSNAEQANANSAGAIPPPPGVGVAPTPGLSSPGTSTPTLPGPPAASATAAVDNSEVEKMKAELDALRRETALIDARANQVAAAETVAASTPPPGAPGTLGGASPLPSDDPKVQALRQKIVNAAAIGKVVNYIPEYERLTFEGGSERNIQVEDTFAVRRGHEIMGYLEVEEVEQGASHAKLTSDNAASETARKPQAGDDVIKWPLF